VFGLSDDPYYEIDETDVKYNDVELLLDEDGKVHDVENIKKLYTALKGIPSSYASEEVLWAGLSHFVFRDYVHTRFMNSYKKNHHKAKYSVERSIINHYFFPNTNARAKIINDVSRLWWYGKMLYLEDEPDDSYRLLHYCKSDINGFLFRAFGSNWPNWQPTIKAALEVDYECNEAQKAVTGKGYKKHREIFNELCNFINEMSGIYLLDAMDEKILHSILKEEYKKIAMRKISDIDPDADDPDLISDD
jgi:hypothetical protein